MNRDNENNERDTDLLIGRNAVLEALKSKRQINSVLMQDGERVGSANEIFALCKKNGVLLKRVTKQKLDFLCPKKNHQGVCAYVAAHEYSTLDEILAVAKEKNEDPFLIVLDKVEDPHNLGAIIRTAECCGAHGVIIPERNAVPLTMTVAKASAGAIEYVKVARVKNINETIKSLKKLGIWVFCADMDGEMYFDADLKGPVCIVIGGEGHGVSRLTKENCDKVISLPMKGKINSLNASVAAGILLCEVSKQRILSKE